MTETGRAKNRSILGEVVDAMASLKLSVVLLTILLYLTWRGTLAQVQLGLHEAQKRYFDTLIAWDRVGDFEFPIPGAYLVLAVLALNLILGGIVRLRIRRETIGVLIGHLGIILLLAAGLVKFHASEDGALGFFEGESQNSFSSYFEWEIAITEPRKDGSATEWIIPGADFVELRPEDATTFSHPNLPFALEVAGYLGNCEPRLIDDAGGSRERVVDGYVLAPLPKEKEAEQNAAGCYARVQPAGGGPAIEKILWGIARPYPLDVAGRKFKLQMRKRTFPLPFAIRLEKFHRKTHPGVDIPSDYSSDVTRIDATGEHPIKISMNEPLRFGGYIVYQTSFSEPGAELAAMGVGYRSVLNVVKNPSDQWPMWACIVIALGLLVQFGIKLVDYSRAQAARRAES